MHVPAISPPVSLGMLALSACACAQRYSHPLRIPHEAWATWRHVHSQPRAAPAHAVVRMHAYVHALIRTCTQTRLKRRGRRPVSVITRILQLMGIAGGFMTRLIWDAATGRLKETEVDRAIDLRNIVVGTGVTWPEHAELVHGPRDCLDACMQWYLE